MQKTPVSTTPLTTKSVSSIVDTVDEPNVRISSVSGWKIFKKDKSNNKDFEGLSWGCTFHIRLLIENKPFSLQLFCLFSVFGYSDGDPEHITAILGQSIQECF